MMHGSISERAVASVGSYQNRSWYVVYTAPKCEHRVHTGVSSAGFGCWFPKEKNYQVRRNKRVVVRTPLYPRYVFCAFDMHREAWFDPIVSIDGVIGFIAKDGVPLKVPTTEIERIQREEFNGLYDNDKLPKAGQEMRLIGGLFDGEVAEVLGANPNGKVKIAINLFGRKVAAEIASGNLERR